MIEPIIVFLLMFYLGVGFGFLWGWTVGYQWGRINTPITPPHGEEITDENE